MNRKILLCWILFLLLGKGLGWTVLAQNLVPNPSFEDTVMCPSAAGQAVYAKFWQTYRETPDYFNVCSAIWQQQVPQNFFGFQEAINGYAYMGIWTFADIEYREFFGLELLTPLQPGNEYYYEYKISKAQNTQGYGWVANNKIGIKLFNGSFSGDNPLPINGSQIYSNDIISDTTNWILIRGYFVPDSTYSQFSIGNHFDDFSTDTIQVVSGGNVAYYYIDDVCISLDSSKCEESFHTSIKKHSRSPSISFYESKLLVKQGYFKIRQITIVDMLGNQIFKTQNIKTEYDLTYLNLKPSVYNVFIETHKETSTHKFINF